MSKLLVVLLVLVLAFVTGDAWLEGSAESKIAAELQRSFDPAGDATVELDGFPMTYRLLTGSIPSATITSSSLKRRGLRFTDLEMTLEDVRFSWSKIMSGAIGDVSVGNGQGLATIQAGMLARAFAVLDGSIELDLVGGEVRATLGPVTGTADVSLEGNDLVLRIEGVDTTLRLALPTVARGVRYTSVTVDSDGAVLEFSMKNAHFEDV